MRSKTQFTMSPLKVALPFLASLFLFILLLFRSSLFSHQLTTHTTTASAASASASSASPSPCNSISNPTCTKIPPSLANALIHYATTNITPQQTLSEISVSAKVLHKKSPCNFLVFGLGHDSLMWTSLNYGGRTVFLEEDKSWINHIQQTFPSLESYHVIYDTKRHHADQLLKIGLQEDDCNKVTDPRFSNCQLAHKGFPTEIYDIDWDVIMVDAPTGYHDEAPGRMTAIYTAGLMARNRQHGAQTHVFVHDVDRKVEDTFSKAFLCQGYFTEQQGRIRHFTIPSHTTPSGRPFCPS